MPSTICDCQLYAACGLAVFWRFAGLPTPSGSWASALTAMRTGLVLDALEQARRTRRNRKLRNYLLLAIDYVLTMGLSRGELAVTERHGSRREVGV